MTPQKLPFKRPSLTEDMAAFFRAHPDEPIDVEPLAKVGGMSGYRTRISECRRWYGMDIRPEKPLQRWPNGRPRARAIYHTLRSRRLGPTPGEQGEAVA